MWAFLRIYYWTDIMEQDRYEYCKADYFTGLFSDIQFVGSWRFYLIWNWSWKTYGAIIADVFLKKHAMLIFWFWNQWSETSVQLRGSSLSATQKWLKPEDQHESLSISVIGLCCWFLSLIIHECQVSKFCLLINSVHRWPFQHHPTCHPTIVSKPKEWLLLTAVSSGC